MTWSHIAPFRAAGVAMLGLSCFVTLWGLWGDWQAGGHFWQQADWLIHADAGPVRRGLFGSAILWVSQTLNVLPVTVVIVLQAVLVLGLFATALAVLRDPRLGWFGPVIAFSPLFFAVFWLQDPDGGLRKELWAFLALMMLAGGGSRARLWLAGTFFLVGLLGHEALVLFVPALVGLTALTFPRRTTVLFGIALVAASGGIMVWHLSFAVGDAAAICAHLADPSLPPNFCDGAIRWVGAEADTHLLRPANRLTLGYLGPLAVSLGAALIPFLLLIRASAPSARRILCAVLALSALPYLPLYLVAIDWGRWMSFHATTAAALIIALIRNGHLSAPQSLPVPLVTLTAPILLAPLHFTGINPDAWIYAAVALALCAVCLAVQPILPGRRHTR